MQFDRGYITPYMVTDSDKMEAVIDDPLILITDKKISSIQEILPVLEQVVQSGKKLVIIAEDVEGEALATIILNKLRGTFVHACAARPPASATGARKMLRDIAALTGGQVISTDLGMELTGNRAYDARKGPPGQDVQGQHHHCRRSAGNPDDIKARVKQITTEIEATTSDYDREKLQERLAKAVRRRGRHQGRRGHRDRNERKETQDRGRAQRHEGRR